MASELHGASTAPCWGWAGGVRAGPAILMTMYGHTSLSEAVVAEGDDDAAPIIPDVGAGTHELVYAVEIEMSVW
jgi:hypothetical protein